MKINGKIGIIVLTAIILFGCDTDNNNNNSNNILTGSIRVIHDEQSNRSARNGNENAEIVELYISNLAYIGDFVEQGVEGTHGITKVEHEENLRLDHQYRANNGWFNISEPFDINHVSAYGSYPLISLNIGALRIGGEDGVVYPFDGGWVEGSILKNAFFGEDIFNIFDVHDNEIHYPEAFNGITHDSDVIHIETVLTVAIDLIDEYWELNDNGELQLISGKQPFDIITIIGITSKEP